MSTLVFAFQVADKPADWQEKIASFSWKTIQICFRKKNYFCNLLYVFLIKIVF